MELNIEKFEEFISNYPIYEYRVLDTSSVNVEERVRIVCREECERYNSTWACPPGCGTLPECKARIQAYPKAILFSSVAEVSDILNFQELLSTRGAHEKITDALGDHLREQGLDIFILSTESCDICAECTYPDGPCRNPDKMHPCLESHGVVVSELAEREAMEYNLGGNTVLWFSMILYR